MDKTKRNKIIYWTITTLVIGAAGISGIFELFTNGPEAVVQSMHVLGYPLYIMKILGFAKILGSIAILTGRFPTLKEWAYAGFTFDFLGATASHLFAGDAANAPAPMIFFVLLMISYYFQPKKTEAHAS